MPSKPAIPQVVNILIVLGIAGYAGLFVLGLALGRIDFSKFVERFLPPQPSTTTLGELGSRCGGQERYPCKPGLTCSAPTGAWGVCIRDERLTSPPVATST